MGEREAIIVKCFTQGHKHHGHGQDSNPHSDDLAIRTQVRCTKPLGHATQLSMICNFPRHRYSVAMLLLEGSGVAAACTSATTPTTHPPPPRAKVWHISQFGSPNLGHVLSPLKR